MYKLTYTLNGKQNLKYCANKGNAMSWAIALKKQGAIVTMRSVTERKAH